MRRILVKGGDSSVADTQVDWDESANIVDHTHIFVDLIDLQQRAHEFSHPYFSWDNSVKFPPRSDVVESILAGNHMVVRLPESLEATFCGEDRDENEEYYDANLTAWFPFLLSASDEKSGDLIRVKDADWEWYFGNQFDWSIFIQDIDQLSTFTWDQYRDPRPVRSGSRALRSPRSDEAGPHVHSEVIAVNNVNRPIAVNVSLLDETGAAPGGSIHLIPEKEDEDFDEFVGSVLTHIFDFNLETTPGWVDEYQLPNYGKISQNIDDVQEQVASVEEEIREGRSFRKLLYDTGDSLEELVRVSLRHMDLPVDPEKPNHRDGGIPLEDETFILEITGTDGGVSIEKISQLDRHIDDAEDEGYGTNRKGLLIVNHYKNQDPENRPLNIDNFIDELEDREYKLLTTPVLYGILCDFERDELTTDDVVQIISEGDTIIDFEDSTQSSGSDNRSQVDSIKRRLSQILE